MYNMSNSIQHTIFKMSIFVCPWVSNDIKNNSVLAAAIEYINYTKQSDVSVHKIWH